MNTLPSNTSSHLFCSRHIASSWFAATMDPASTRQTIPTKPILTP